jgi:hypothetical protein
MYRRHRRICIASGRRASRCQPKAQALKAPSSVASTNGMVGMARRERRSWERRELSRTERDKGRRFFDPYRQGYSPDVIVTPLGKSWARADALVSVMEDYGWGL